LKSTDVTVFWLSLLHIAGKENLYLNPEIADTAFSFIVFLSNAAGKVLPLACRDFLLPFITFYCLMLYNQRGWNVLLSEQYGSLLKHPYFETNIASKLNVCCTASQKYYFASWVRKHVIMLVKSYFRLYETRPLANQIYPVDNHFHSPKRYFFITDFFFCWFSSFMQAIDSSSVHAILFCR
jgi:hypothetical protein